MINTNFSSRRVYSSPLMESESLNFGPLCTSPTGFQTEDLNDDTILDRSEL